MTPPIYRARLWVLDGPTRTLAKTHDGFDCAGIGYTYEQARTLLTEPGAYVHHVIDQLDDPPGYDLDQVLARWPAGEFNFYIGLPDGRCLHAEIEPDRKAGR